MREEHAAAMARAEAAAAARDATARAEVAAARREAEAEALAARETAAQLVAARGGETAARVVGTAEAEAAAARVAAAEAAAAEHAQRMAAAFDMQVAAVNSQLAASKARQQAEVCDAALVEQLRGEIATLRGEMATQRQQLDAAQLELRQERSCPPTCLPTCPLISSTELSLSHDRTSPLTGWLPAYRARSNCPRSARRCYAARTSSRSRQPAASRRHKRSATCWRRSALDR